MDSLVVLSAFVFGGIFTTSAECAVVLTNPYNGKVIKGLANSSVSFSWTFNGDFDFITWGLKLSDDIDVNTTLISLTKAGPLTISIPSSYVGRVSGEWNNNLSPGKATFTLSSIQLQDSAFYACRISPSQLGASNVGDYIELVVVDPPKAFPDQQIKSADIGESASLILSASGAPPPNITWYRNGTQVSGIRYEIIQVSADSSQLTIKNVTSADHGYYDCQATSYGLKPATARFFLGVLTSVQEDSVLMKPAYEAEIGEEVALYCPVNGYPPPEVEWTFDGKKVKTSLSKVLVIPNVMENDYGSYLCTAKSLEGTVGPLTITLSKTNISVIKDATEKTEIKPGDKFKWTGVPRALDYIIRIYGDKNSSVLVDGKESSMEILHSSVKDEHNKGDPVEVVIEVLAIGKSSAIGKGGPFAKKILSAATTPKVSFLSVILLFVVALILQ